MKATFVLDEFRGKRGRGVHGKHLVLGLIKRHGKVYAQVVTNCSALVLNTYNQV